MNKQEDVGRVSVLQVVLSSPIEYLYISPRC